MPLYELLQWGAAITGLVFLFAFGAIVGSFLNVVAYRLPEGQGLIDPPSSCPVCGTRLSWRENLPIVGWIRLGGRCRYCRSRISVRYPLVELLVAVLFGGSFALWFMEPSALALLDPSVGLLQPDFARADLLRVWPTYALVLLLIGSLIAITLIDARTFLIPLSIPWLATGVAAAAHPLHAGWLTATGWAERVARNTGHPWTIPTPEGPLLGLTVGASAGLGLSVLLLRLGAIPRSFDDYEEWERRAEEAERSARGVGPEEARAADLPIEDAEPSPRELLVRTLLLTGPALAFMLVGAVAGRAAGEPMLGVGGGAAVGLVIGVVLRNRAAGSGAADGEADGEPAWLQYPHARRETLKELLFLAPVLVGAGIGWGFAPLGGGLIAVPPLWLAALGGSALGYLAGGAIVWAVRILGTLAFGKEAMGLGDVHLMAAVGAVLGWADPLLAFVTAPFLGLAWAAMGAAFRAAGKGMGSAMPFGPHLAAATLLVVFCKPGYEALLSAIAGRAIDLH